VLAALGLLATATLTYAAERRLQASTAPKPAVTKPTVPTLVVPEVRGQVYVFAEGILEDGGFGWNVPAGNGYAANLVLAQSPLPGTKVLDTGAPEITLTLASSKHFQGTPLNVSPFAPTQLRLATEAAAAPATTPAPATKHVAAAAKPAAKKAAAPAGRTPDFVVEGAPKEPSDEMPLVNRARMLAAWLAKHRTVSAANEGHFLYQNAWVVDGAKFGWWHGAQALRALIAADRQAQKQWGVGAKSESVARAALAEVEARAK